MKHSLLESIFVKDKIEPYIVVKDHSVSGEIFQLVQSRDIGILKTEPQPNPENLHKYYFSEDYISHTDSRRNIFETAYQFIKSISLKRKLNLINDFNLSGKSILDIGCGTGDFLQVAYKQGWTIKGVEPNKKARELANKKTNNSILDSTELEELPAGQFDVITLWHVLEHLPNIDNQLGIFKKLLKTDGRMVIAVPNYKCYDASYYKSFWAAYDVPRHLWHFSRNGIEELFSKKNLELETSIPLKFDAFYVSLLSEKYKFGFMNPFMAFWVGLKSNYKAKRSGEYSSLIYVFKFREN